MTTNKEIQCYDGDGKAPPELLKLIEENKELKQTIQSLEERFQEDTAEISELRDRVTQSEIKLRQISNILAGSDMGYHTGSFPDEIEERESEDDAFTAAMKRRKMPK